MWRVRWPDGRLSDMTNLSRAKDAVACFIETDERRQRGRHSPLEGRRYVKTDSWGKRPTNEQNGLSRMLRESPTVISSCDFAKFWFHLRRNTETD
jgi:hypothetical protein